jgi:hypothetical protein
MRVEGDTKARRYVIVDASLQLTFPALAGEEHMRLALRVLTELKGCVDNLSTHRASARD